MAGTLDANWTVQNTNFKVGSAGTNDYVGQRFVTILGGNIDKISVYIRKSNSPTGNYSIGIYSDDGSKKPNTLLNTVETSSVSDLSTSFAWIDFDLTGNEVTVDASTAYHVVINYDGDATNNMIWGADTLGDYSDGHDSTSSDGSTWLDGSIDMDFKIYISEAVADTGNFFNFF